MNRVAIWFFISLLFVASGAHAQFASKDRARHLTEQLQSSSMAARMEASRQIFGSGINDKGLNDLLASIIGSALPSLDKDSPRVEELAWHVKALSASGDETYMPVILLAAQSPVKKLARHAKDAKAILEKQSAEGRPYLIPTKVAVITETQAENCAYVDQQMCKTGRGAEKCIEWHQTGAASRGANAVMLLNSNTKVGPATVIPIGSSAYVSQASKTTMMASYYLCQ
ncbi:MAG TPA: hypothetical protein PK399_02455 [Thermomonas sp.]|jgi:hypothetical protein|nr:hypothetical protein [Thermomonas sp.]